MLLDQQEREPEPEPDRERVPPPPNQRPAMQPIHQYPFDDTILFDDPLRFANQMLQAIYGNHVNDAPHQQGRNQANFDWMREPGRCNLTVSWMDSDSE